MPTAAAALAKGSTNSLFPPLLPPAAPGICTLWVASKITGANSRMITKERISTTKFP